MIKTKKTERKKDMKTSSKAVKENIHDILWLSSDDRLLDLCLAMCYRYCFQYNLSTLLAHVLGDEVYEKYDLYYQLFLRSF